MKPMLSKSKFTRGWQCEKMAYLDAHRAGLATPHDAATLARFAAGTRFGELAREAWPGGVLVSEPGYRHDDAVWRTAKLLETPGVDVIFEAGFTGRGTRVRADVLVRSGDSDQWDLIEVKSSSSPRPVYDIDLTVQTVVLEASGVNVGSTSLALVDPGYVLGSEGLDPSRLFRVVDRGTEVSVLKPGVLSLVDRLHEVIAAGSEPAVKVGPGCAEPYACDYFDYCTSDRPGDWVKYLPGFGLGRVQKLEAAGVFSIADILSGERLNDLQRRAVVATSSGEVWVSPSLSDVLSNVEHPLRFIDFEAATPTVPLYVATSSREQIPFQWSCHTLHEDGRLEHSEFLAVGVGDPRREFAETLLREMGDRGSVLVYSSYEASTLKRIGERFDDLWSSIDHLLGRFTDLLALVRTNYYHPDLRGSFSIKNVLPVMAPGFDYSDLAVQEGETAASSFVDLVEGRVLGADVEQLRSDMLRYCARDTEAMVRIWQRLKSFAENAGD